MKRIFLLVILLLMPLWMGQWHAVLSGSPPSASYLVEENFESGSAPTGWTIGGDWIWNAQAPTPLQGTYAAQSKSFGTPTAYIGFTAQGEVWWYFQFEVADTTTATTLSLCPIKQADGTAICTVNMNTSGQIFITWADFSASATSVDVLPDGGKVHIFGYYKKAAGTAKISIGWSTDGTNPTSGNKYVSLTSGNYNVDCGRIVLGGYPGANVAAWFDRYIVSSTAIPDNP